MSQASRDANRVPTILGVSNVDFTTATPIYVNPNTGALLISGTTLGSVTSVSVVTANGVSGSVANPTTTPAITLTLGVITPTTVNGVTFTGSGSATLALGTKSLTISNTMTLAGTDSKTYTFPTTDATIARTDAGQTFTGVNSMTSPIFTTPDLGVPSAVVLTNATWTASALTAGVATTTTITDDTSTNATMYPTWVTTSSGNQAQKVSSTKLTFNPSTGNLASTTYNGVTISGSGAVAVGSKTLTISNTITLAGTDTKTYTFPTTDATIARTDAANTFVGASTASAWVLTAPTITTSIVPTSNDGAALGSTGNQFSDLFLAETGVINWDAGDLTLTQTNNELVLGGGNLDIGANTLRLAGPLDYTVEPAVDDTFEGPSTNDLNAGATIAQWDLVILSSASKWVLTDANTASLYTGMLAMATASGTDTNPLLVALKGSIIRNDGWSWTAGATLYMSETAGAIIATQPTTTDAAIRVIGFALTDDCIYFDPSPDYITHT